MQEAAFRRTDENVLPGLRPIAPVKQPADSAGGNAALHIDSSLRDQEQAEVLPLEPAAQLFVGVWGQARARKGQAHSPLFSERTDRRLRRERRVAAAHDHQRLAEFRDLLRSLPNREHRAGHYALRRVQPTQKIRAIQHVGPKLHMRVKQVFFSGQQIRQADTPPNIGQLDVDHRMRLLYLLYTILHFGKKRKKNRKMPILNQAPRSGRRVRRSSSAKSAAAPSRKPGSENV